MNGPDKNYKPDKEYPRLKRRIREKSSHKGWVYIYNFRGRTRFYTIGQVKLTEARKIAARLQYEIAQGKDPQGEKLTQRKVGTFGELYDERRCARSWSPSSGDSSNARSTAKAWAGTRAQRSSRSARGR